jgi:phage-related protein
MLNSHKYFNYKDMDNMDYMEVLSMSQQIEILFKLFYLKYHMKIIQFVSFFRNVYVCVFVRARVFLVMFDLT